ncbi:MAG: amidohydrolase family protein [Alphaproteobacteria bacterium]|nr:amidohydrolase family protein [Alphaproteobacteria bacterium]
MRTLIRNAAWAILWDGTRHTYAHGQDIELQGGRITAIRRHEPGPFEGQVIDGAGQMVMPGLVNIHAHPTTEPHWRGVREDHGVPEQQMTGLFERSQAFRLDDAGREAAMRMAYAELMAAGVTSLVDLSAPFGAWMRVMAESGLRVWAGPGFASARWGMSAPQTVDWHWDKPGGRAQFQAAQALMDAAEADPSGRLSAIVFPAQIDTVEEELLRESAALARAKGRPFTIHIAQAVVEVREIIRRHNRTPVQWAADIGLLSPSTVFGHCIFVDEHPSIGWHTKRDIRLLAEHGVAVAHCPTPFARYGEHLKDFGHYRAAGVPMGMGTDCAPHNIIEEMRLAIILARNASRDLAAADTSMVFHAATVGGADALHRPDLGRLVEGAAADLVLVDCAHPMMMPTRDPLRSLVHHAAERAVRRVMVAGETIFQDGRCLKLDVAEAAGILMESQARAMRNAAKHDYLGRDGDVIAPLTLGWRAS